MQFALGALTVAVIGLAIALWMALKENKGTLKTLRSQFDILESTVRSDSGADQNRFNAISRQILELPRAGVQNVIHLGIKPVKVEVDVSPIKIPVNPQDFHIKAGKLREKLLDGLATIEHPSTGILAYCILEHAGIGNMLDGPSKQDVQKCLTRLLSNEDQEGAKNFLSLLADSIATGTTPALS